MLTSAAEVSKWGAPTFDVWVVRKDFSAAHPDFVTQFVKVTSQYDADYLAHPEDFAAGSANAAAIAKITGVQAADVPAQLKEAVWPTADQLATPALLEGGTAKAIAFDRGVFKATRQDRDRAAELRALCDGQIRPASGALKQSRAA